MYALADCNSFFASCERAFRPDLWTEPVIVLSNNDGCVVARSVEAKRLGIPMGEAFFKIKHLVAAGKVRVFSGNYRLYDNLSNRVMRSLEQWTPEIEIYSIDEAFLSLAGLRIDDYTAYGTNMATTMKRHTCIPVSVGIAPTKTLSKIAAETAKNRDLPCVALIDEADRDAVLKNFEIGDVWGVGRRLAKSFQRLGLRTAYDLSRVDPYRMRKNHSIVQEKTVRELNGEPCFGLDAPQPKQNILVSRSFGETTDRLEDMLEAVTTFAAAAAAKARAQGSVASAVQVQANTSRFAQESAYYSRSTIVPFAVPTSSTIEIIQAACRGMRAVYRKNTPFKRAGAMLLNLVDAEGARSQGYLFEKDEERDSEQRETERRLMESLDRINGRFGRGSLFFGIQGFSHAWNPSRNMVSPGYVDNWDELPVVRAK